MEPSARDFVAARLPWHYGRNTLRTLGALIEVVSPRDVFELRSMAPVLATVLSFIPFLALPLRWGLPIALGLFELAPVLFGFGRRRFSSLRPAEAAAYLRAWEHGRPPLTQVYTAFHALVLCSFYQQPDVLRALEVDWQGRARELLQRRAQLLGMPTEISNPRNVHAGKPAG